MNQHWIIDAYRKVKAVRDQELNQILSLLRPKAVNDPEIGEALRLLEKWARPTADENVENYNKRNDKVSTR